MEPSESTKDLLGRVAERLTHTPSTSDYAVLVKWRILTLCQYLLGLPDVGLEQMCRCVLEVFASKGVGPEFDSAMDSASGIARRLEGAAAVLPSISSDKRAAVSNRLNELASEPDAIERGLAEVGEVRDHIRDIAVELPLTGFQYRFDRIAAILEDPAASLGDRTQAAAAVRYVKEESDVIPDTLGIIGLMDDDYALRITLESLPKATEFSILHWSEKVASLWDDLPFLQGVTLNRDQQRVPTNWLDRLSAYVVYTHALSGQSSPLAMLVPSIESSPLHTVVTLLGLLTLEGLTAGAAKALDLRVGQTYEIDGKFHARFEGVVASPPGWLELKVRDGRVFRPPSLVDRMVPVDERRLTRGADFPAMPRPKEGGDPIQQFFHWNSSIGTSVISKRLALVASTKRAQQILRGVESHGIKILEHGLVRFLGEADENADPHSALILVVSSLTAVRRLLGLGMELQCVLVDGYEPLQKGRHELPFLRHSAAKLPIVVWTAKGYYPPITPSWLELECIEASRDDLAEALKLDATSDDPSARVLRQALKGPDISVRAVSRTLEEARLVEALTAYIADIRASSAIPDHLRYQLASTSSSLLRLVSATPARWVDVRAVALGWMAQLNDKWEKFAPSAKQRLLALRDSQLAIGRLFDALSDSENAAAKAIVAHLGEGPPSVKGLYFVCDSSDQLGLVASLFDSKHLNTVTPVMLRDLPVCSDCIAAGWGGLQFARRLFAHNPRSLALMVEHGDLQRWTNVSRSSWEPLGPSLVGTVYGSASKAPARVDRAPDDELSWIGASIVSWEEEAFDAVVLGVSGRSEIKVLARQAKAYVEEEDSISERAAITLKPGDRVILGSGISSWSPAEEFTEAVVTAVRSSNPHLVSQAKEWRRLLRDMVDAEHLSILALQSRLRALGIERETPTLEGWLNLARASPISPQKGRAELEIIWRATPPSEREPLDVVAAACKELRRLRSRSGYALIRAWKGESSNIAVEGEQLDRLVGELRRKVEVYQVETVASQTLPRSLDGCWLPTELLDSMTENSRVETVA